MKEKDPEWSGLTIGPPLCVLYEYFAALFWKHSSVGVLPEIGQSPISCCLQDLESRYAFCAGVVNMRATINRKSLHTDGQTIKLELKVRGRLNHCCTLRFARVEHHNTTSAGSPQMRTWRQHERGLPVRATLSCLGGAPAEIAGSLLIVVPHV